AAARAAPAAVAALQAHSAVDSAVALRKPPPPQHKERSPAEAPIWLRDLRPICDSSELLLVDLSSVRSLCCLGPGELAAPAIPLVAKAIIKMRPGAKLAGRSCAGPWRDSPMADPSSTLTIQPTGLVGLLESTHIPHRLNTYRGALTPQQLNAPEVETAALAKGAGLHDLGWMRRVAVRGQHRFRWLSGMVSNTVNDLFPNTGAWNFVLTPQGRIQGDLTVWRAGEDPSPVRRTAEIVRSATAGGNHGTPFAGESGLELEIAADQFDKLLAQLNRYIIMDDVELVPLGEEQGPEGVPQTAVGLTGPLAEEVLDRVGLPTISQPMSGKSVEWNGWQLRILRNYGLLAPHYEFFLPAAGLGKLWSCLKAAGADPVGCAALEAFRIAEAIPLYGIDIADRDLPQETSQMRALHFNKGCYLGQEIVERIRSRGNVHRHLRPLELTGPVPAAGTELMLDGKAAGRITSAAALPLADGSRIFALGMIRAEFEEREQPFAYTATEGQGTAHILNSPPKLIRK